MRLLFKQIQYALIVKCVLGLFIAPPTFYSTDHKQLNIYSHMLAKSTECAWSTCRRTYTAHEWKYYIRSYECASCECRASTNIASKSTIRVRTGLIDYLMHVCMPTSTRALVQYSRTRTVLAHSYSTRGDSASLVSATLTTRKHSLHPRELSTSEH